MLFPIHRHNTRKKMRYQVILFYLLVKRIDKAFYISTIFYVFFNHFHIVKAAIEPMKGAVK